MTEQRIRDRTKANPHARGTSNGNERGSSVVRRERKEWLLETYASDVKLIRVTWGSLLSPKVEVFVLTPEEVPEYEEGMISAEEVPTARCYMCGCLLWMETVTVDRIKPGCLGGRYRTAKMDRREGVTNVRPACAKHNSSIGGAMANSKSLKPAKRRALRRVK